MTPEGAEPILGTETQTLKAEVLLRELLLDFNSEAVTPDKFGKKIEKFREALGLSPLEFAQKCEVSIATYYRWVQGAKSKPPRNRVDHFKTLLGKQVDDVRIERKSVQKSLRRYLELLDRQETCKRQWSLKTMLPFRAAKHPGIKQRLTAFLLSEKNPNFNCVFYGEKDSEESQVSKWAAMNSFGQFKQMLYRQNQDTLKRIRGWLVEDEALAFRLGLTTLSLGLTILEYDDAPEKKKERDDIPVDDREVDYFFEIPLAVHPDSGKEEIVANEDEEIRWVEWPAHRSSQDWVYRRKVLESILDESAPNGVKEFLGTAAEIEDFRPRDYPS